MPDEIDDLIKKATALTDEEFKNRFSGLTSLTDADITKIIEDTGISKEDLSQILGEIKNASNTNEKTAVNIMNINKGVGVLVSIVKKFL